MIIDLTTARDKTGRVIDPVSPYNPDDDVKKVTAIMLRRFMVANSAKNKPYREFNNMSLLERQSVDQVRFNSYQFYQSGDPDDDWKSNAVRPITRNRVISIAAHLTGSIMYPTIYAQNEDDNDDKDTAMVMRDLTEWAADNSNPGYEKTMMYAIIAAMVNPKVVVHTEYAKMTRFVRNDDGTQKEIPDDEYSGFCDTIVPLDEWWEPNFYEQNVQRQPYLIWRRVITYEEAQLKYGDENNWKFIKPGVQIMFVEANNLFYEQYDQNLRGYLVEEVLYWDRNEDIALKFVNGVIMTKADRPNPREDKKYPFFTAGYELVDEGKFAFYKSLVNKMGPDEEVVQTLYRMIIDGTFLQLFPPGVVFGDETVDSSVMAPATITTFDNADSKFQQLNPGNNLSAGLNVLNKVEDSMSESSIRNLQFGTRMSAYAVSAIEQEMKTMMGLFGRMIGFAVYDFSQLRISDILQYMTLGDVMQETSPAGSMKFQSFLMHDKVIGGKKKTRKISFKSQIFDSKEITQEQKDNYEMDLYMKAGNDTEIVEVDPVAFRKMKYKIKVTPEVITPPSDTTRKALNLEEYDRAIANPLADQEAVFRDLLLGSYDATKGDPEKYINKNPQSLAGMVGAGQKPGMPPQGMTPGNQAPGNSAVAQIANQRGQESTAQLGK